MRPNDLRAARVELTRAERTQQTIARYRGKKFDWANGATCIHLARTQARNMGHKVPAMPAIRSALSARTALRGTGFDTLEALLDSLFPRIVPASMLVGDLAMVLGDEGFGSIFVGDGYGTLLGWSDIVPQFAPVVGAITAVTAAWRL